MEQLTFVVADRRVADPHAGLRVEAVKRVLEQHGFKVVGCHAGAPPRPEHSLASRRPRRRGDA